MAGKAWQQHHPLCLSAGRRSWHWNSCCWKYRASQLLGSQHKGRPSGSAAQLQGAGGSAHPSYLFQQKRMNQKLKAAPKDKSALDSHWGGAAARVTAIPSSSRTRNSAVSGWKLCTKINWDSDCSAGSEYIVERSHRLWEGQICIQLIKDFTQVMGRGSILQLYFPISLGENLLLSYKINSHHLAEKLQGNRELSKWWY